MRSLGFTVHVLEYLVELELHKAHVPRANINTMLFTGWALH